MYITVWLYNCTWLAFRRLAVCFVYIASGMGRKRSSKPRKVRLYLMVWFNLARFVFVYRII